MHRSMAVDAWFQAMRLMSLYTRDDAQSYGSRFMVWCLCIRGLMHNSLVVDAWL